LPNSFFPKEITYGFYEAHTHLEGGVSRCTTCVDVRHLYDTRTTPIGIVKQNLPKIYIFFFDTLKELNMYWNNVLYIISVGVSISCRVTVSVSEYVLYNKNKKWLLKITANFNPTITNMMNLNPLKWINCKMITFNVLPI
jgi:putative N-acetylmannosamine-6-phosphate epimerase